MEQLQKKGVSFSPFCLVCQDKIETFTHILFQCNVAKDTWKSALQYRMEDLNTGEDMGTYWIKLSQTKGATALFLDLSLSWIIWKGKNNRIFQRVSKSS